MTVTGDLVFEAFKNDPRIDSDDSQLMMMESYIRALPTILADSLDKRLTLELLLEAKMRFCAYCLDNGIGDRAREILKELLGSGDDLDDMVNLLVETLDELVKQMKGQMPNIAKMLADQGLTEHEVLVDDRTGLNEDMLKLLEAHKLTLGELLCKQPSVVVINQ